jgi:hypothetical protein
MSDPTHTDPRAVWLRSLGWREIAENKWTGQVAATRGGRYKPMSLDHAFEVALKRSVIDKAFRIEIAGGGVRLALPWRELAPEDREAAP